jgi:hypothetical protein
MIKLEYDEKLQCYKLPGVDIQYDDETHIYLINGERYPSITQVTGMLSDVSRIPKQVLEAAGARGRAVHAACESLNKGVAPLISPEYKLYFNGYKKFLSETAYKPIKNMSEVMIVSMKYRYAGRLDQLYSLAKAWLIGDIKTSARFSYKWCAQLVAYWEAVEEMGIGKLSGRIIIQPNKEGAYTLTKETDKDMLPRKESFSLFLKLLEVYNIKMRLDKLYCNKGRLA